MDAYEAITNRNFRENLPVVYQSDTQQTSSLAHKHRGFVNHAQN